MYLLSSSLIYSQFSNKLYSFLSLLSCVFISWRLIAICVKSRHTTANRWRPRCLSLRHSCGNGFFPLGASSHPKLWSPSWLANRITPSSPSLTLHVFPREGVPTTGHSWSFPSPSPPSIAAISWWDDDGNDDDVSRQRMTWTPKIDSARSYLNHS